MRPKTEKKSMPLNGKRNKITRIKSLGFIDNSISIKVSFIRWPPKCDFICLWNDYGNFLSFRKSFECFAFLVLVVLLSGSIYLIWFGGGRQRRLMIMILLCVRFSSIKIDAIVSILRGMKLYLILILVTRYWFCM